MADRPRLIEVAFPLKQASLDSVHEKNVRHGHISTLHIWPARRPLAACRAALIATLLPDPGNDEERRALLLRLAGRVVQRVQTKKGADGGSEQKIKEETEGGVLHWGRESGPDLQWFRERIREAYGGRAPRVLDPFAGGGAIPLEAMRLGCEVTAADINPVAWFILKCTLEYPQRLAGKTWPLPHFAVQDRGFMSDYLRAQGLKGARLRDALDRLGLAQSAEPTLPGLGAELDLQADLAWHVRAWGRWVVQRGRADLERFYPIVDGNPTVAYLWARTVTCKNCRATIPLLKTRWLCKKERKRVLLGMQPNAGRDGVVFAVQDDVPVSQGSTAQRKAHDKTLGAGTMSRSGATCPCCGAIMTLEDIRVEGQAGRLSKQMTAVVVDGRHGKEYRLPTPEDARAAEIAGSELDRVFVQIPFGVPEESTPAGGGSGAGRAFSVQGYGLMRWRDLFTPRQLLALGTFVLHTRAAFETMRNSGYSAEWVEAVGAELAIAVDKLADRQSTLCRWDMGYTKVNSTFTRFALPILWDFAEGNPLSATTGNYLSCLEWVAKADEHASAAAFNSPPARAALSTATTSAASGVCDVIVTDPPYYDAIPYSDLMDFFCVWLRRTLNGLSNELDAHFREPLAPKWNEVANDGELIDDSSRFGGDSQRSKAIYEDGMFRAFLACSNTLTSDGRLVVVFAHKQPDAWETLVYAIIRAGFVVNGSWPIQTEMGNRSRAHGSAALASSVWLVCKKRAHSTGPGWDNRVLEEMRTRITVRLRDFWDAGIRGPDFVWAATGPALEAYSQYPVVKKANDPGQIMTVSEFLGHVRRLVVDFVVGRVLSSAGSGEGQIDVSGLDDVTTYYLLHRHDFGLEAAPAGACILYALSCGLSDRALTDQWDLLLREQAEASAGEEEDGDSSEDEGVEDADEGKGSAMRLKPWHRRKRAGLGHGADRGSHSGVETLPLLTEEEAKAPAANVPLIDQVHRLMHLWRAGDVGAVDEYLDLRGLRRSPLFQQLLQALIELAPPGSEERALLESISNHLAGRGVAPREEKMPLPGLH